METNNPFLIYLNKNIELFTIKGFHYRGELVSCSLDFLTIQDNKIGLTSLRISEVARILEVK